MYGEKQTDSPQAPLSIKDCNIRNSSESHISAVKSAVVLAVFHQWLKLLGSIENTLCIFSINSKCLFHCGLLALGFGLSRV